MARPSDDRRGAVGAFGLWLAGLAGLCAIGCDSLSFTPPRPPELSNPTPAVRPSVDALGAQGMRSIDVILAPRGDEDIEYLVAAARIQAGLDKVRARVVDIPSAGSESSGWRERAEAIKKAAAENPVAILVESPASPDPSLSEAVAEARERGVLVVALGRSLDGEDEKGAEPMSPSASAPRRIVVAPEPFAWSAEVLVADAIRNAKNGGLDPKDGALLLINSTSDPLVQDRIDALREVLKGEGVEAIEELRFAGPDDNGREKLIEHLKAHPKTAMIFATDYLGVNIADKLTEILKGTHPYVIAGYSSDESHARNQTLTAQCAAVGVYSADRLLRKGISVAAAVAGGRGTEFPDHVEVRVVMLESSPDSGLPRSALEEGETEPSEPAPDSGEAGEANVEAKAKTKIELKD